MTDRAEWLTVLLLVAAIIGGVCGWRLHELWTPFPHEPAQQVEEHTDVMDSLRADTLRLAQRGDSLNDSLWALRADCAPKTAGFGPVQARKP